MPGESAETSAPTRATQCYPQENLEHPIGEEDSDVYVPQQPQRQRGLGGLWGRKLLQSAAERVRGVLAGAAGAGAIEEGGVVAGSGEAAAAVGAGRGLGDGAAAGGRVVMADQQQRLR